MKKKKRNLKNYLLRIISTIEKKYLITSNTTKQKDLIFKIFPSLSDLYSYLSNFSDFIIVNLSNHKLNNIKKCRIWSFSKSFNSIEFYGLDHIINKEKFSEFFLIQNKNDISKQSIVDNFKYINVKNFWLRNRYLIYYYFLVTIDQNFNKKNFSLNKISFSNFANLSETKNLILYLLLNYFRLILSKINFLFKKKTRWTIHYGKLKNIKNIKNLNSFSKLNFIKILPYKYTEWADPFVYKYKDKTYIFFENNSLINKKAKISYGEIYKNKFIFKGDILKKKYHLSYPFTFNDNKNFYLMPESSEILKLCIYKSKKFPKKWKLFKTFFNGEKVFDSTLYNYKNSKWLLINKGCNLFSDMNNFLYAYKIIGNFKKLIPHNLNPISKDSTSSRNAGFINLDNTKKTNNIVPFQLNFSNIYGAGIIIKNIQINNLEHYKEKIIKKISRNKFPSSDGLHHFSYHKKNFVYDVRD